MVVVRKVMYIQEKDVVKTLGEEIYQNSSQSQTPSLILEPNHYIFTLRLRVPVSQTPHL